MLPCPSPGFSGHGVHACRLDFQRMGCLGFPRGLVGKPAGFAPADGRRSTRRCIRRRGSTLPEQRPSIAVQATNCRSAKTRQPRPVWTAAPWSATPPAGARERKIAFSVAGRFFPNRGKARSVAGACPTAVRTGAQLRWSPGGSLSAILRSVERAHAAIPSMSSVPHLRLQPFICRGVVEVRLGIARHKLNVNGHWRSMMYVSQHGAYRLNDFCSVFSFESI